MNGGLQAAKALLARPHPSTRLWALGRVDVSMEAAIVEEPRWWPLFTEEERAVARARLADYRYEPKGG